MQSSKRNLPREFASASLRPEREATAKDDMAHFRNPAQNAMTANTYKSALVRPESYCGRGPLTCGHSWPSCAHTQEAAGSYDSSSVKHTRNTFGWQACILSPAAAAVCTHDPANTPEDPNTLPKLRKKKLQPSRRGLRLLLTAKSPHSAANYVRRRNPCSVFPEPN